MLRNYSLGLGLLRKVYGERRKFSGQLVALLEKFAVGMITDVLHSWLLNDCDDGSKSPKKTMHTQCRAAFLERHKLFHAHVIPGYIDTSFQVSRSWASRNPRENLIVEIFVKLG